jgi:hypothetical protein
VLVVFLGTTLCAGAERKWQVGTWTAVGTTMTPWIGDASAGNRPMTARPVAGTGPMTQVATYVIETRDLRLELQGIEPVAGGKTAFDLEVTVGSPVTFAIEGKRTVYVRRNNESEQRLLLVRKTAKKPS